VSYAALHSFGGIEPWERLMAEADEVYLWRATFQGANIDSIVDMQAIAGAIGRNQRLGLDLRGIAVQAAGSGNTYDVDAAFTAKANTVYTPGMSTAGDIATRVATELADRFPGLTITNARLEQITDDEPKHPALNFWLYHTIIWDIPGGSALPILEEGKPTHAFARFEGLYRGKAEQGASLKKWPMDQPPPNGNGGANGGAESIVPLVLLAGGAAVAVYLIFQRTSRQGAAT
jgi:hypothetical protein